MFHDLSSSGFYYHRKKENIPYLKIERLIRYKQEDVEVYLKSCRVSVANTRRQIGAFTGEELRMKNEEWI